MTRKHTTESYIQKCIQRWGDKFDYSKTVYFDSKTRVTVRCPTHGFVEVLPESHTMNRENNTGCPKCGEEISTQKRRTTYKDFLETAVKMFDGKYTYIESSWSGIKNSIDYICPIHGKRSMIAQSHIFERDGNTGCSKCGKEVTASKLRLTYNEFLQRSRNHHGDQYDYLETDYNGGDNVIRVWCKVEGHGYFYPVARDHAKGTGCPECKGLRKKTTEKFISEATRTHGELYGYENSDYQGALTKLTITCFIHGDFYQTPANHLNGAGCPDCAELKKGWDNLPDLLKCQQKHLEECQLYLYTVEGYPDQVKPGISSNHKRRSGSSPTNIPYGDIVCEWICSTRIESRMIELAVMQDTHHLFDPPWELSDRTGFSELRRCDPGLMKSIIQVRLDELNEYLSDGGNVWRWSVDHIKMPEDIKRMYLDKCKEVEGNTV